MDGDTDNELWVLDLLSETWSCLVGGGERLGEEFPRGHPMLRSDGRARHSMNATRVQTTRVESPGPVVAILSGGFQYFNLRDFCPESPSPVSGQLNLRRRV